MLNNSDVPKETTENHVLGGRVGSGQDYSFAFYNPHNARFYFDFNKWNFKPDMTLFRRINSVELTLDFDSCRIVVKKLLIEITNKIEKERRFLVDGSLDNRKECVSKAVDTLESECVVVLKRFIGLYGGSSSFKCVKKWIPDNKILHDRLIDSIPSEVTFRTDVVKKVYNSDPKNLEVSSPEGASRLLSNLALVEVAPEISFKLDGLHSDLASLAHENKEMALNMASHIPLVQKATAKLEADMDAVKSLVSVVSELKDAVIDLKQSIRSDRLRSLKSEWGW